MAVSRAQMGKQLEGNKMNCGTKKMNMGGKMRSAGIEDMMPRMPMKDPEMRKTQGMKKGGVMRGDGCCMKGKTKGKMR